MNTAEHIVELYYRYVKKCLTIADVKVQNGNNRQFDLLAYNIEKGIYYHVETNVVHDLKLQKNYKVVEEEVLSKFCGTPKEKAGEKTDSKRKKSYLTGIIDTYRNYCFPYDGVIRVICKWCFFDGDKLAEEKLDKWRKKLSEKAQLREDKIVFLSFRDEVLPELIDTITSANYEDELLRLISLQKKKAEQEKPAANRSIAKMRAEE